MLPETTQWRYAAVTGAIPQTNAAIGKGGDKRYAGDAKNHVRLKLDEDMLKENPLVEVSARPLEAGIDD